MPRLRLLVAGAAALATALPAVARADVEFKFGGAISSDIRYRWNGEDVPVTFPNQLQLMKNGFSRNENLIKAQLQLRIGEKIKAVADADLYLYGFSDVHNIDSLTLRENVDPYRLEVTSAYIDIYKLAPGLDLRIGRQVVVWGSADKFNPTNNVNALDFSDPLLFGKALGNNMVRIDYNPIGDWTLTGVLVPIFRPAQLPRTATVALLDPYRPLGVADGGNLARNIYIFGTQLDKPDIIRTYTSVPEPSINNLQWGLRLAGRVLNQDFSLSWYHGRFTFPTPSTALFHQPATKAGGIKSVDVGVMWPRMDVLGADLGGTLPKLGGMGYWIEAALIFPQRVDYAIYTDMDGAGRQEVRITEARLSNTYFANVDDQGVLSTRFPTGINRAMLVDSTPFLKLTVGGDWSIGKHVYLNLQYVHGFFDEFGDGWAWRQSSEKQDSDQTHIWKQRRIGDYGVGGLDLKFLSDTLLLRLFGIIKMPSMYFDGGVKFDEYRATGMIFPQIAYQVWDGTEITLGAFIYLGDRSTKFGDPATGASEGFLKVKFTY